MERESFIFYASFYQAIKEIPNENQLKVYQAITNFALTGTEPTDLNGIEKAVFILVKPQIIANNKRYENGCNGGRPRKKTNGYENKKPNNNQNITKPKPNVNDNENENDNVNVNVVKVVSKARFIKPTKEEITDFAITNNLSTDMVDEYFDYYEGNGWKVGRNPMKDWKATYRRWCRNSFKSHKKDEIEEILKAGRDL